MARCQVAAVQGRAWELPMIDRPVRPGPHRCRVPATRQYVHVLGQLAKASADWQPPGGWTADRNSVLATCQCALPQTIWVRGRDAATDLLARP
jgi:hypothetical protein